MYQNTPRVATEHTPSSFALDMANLHSGPACQQAIDPTLLLLRELVPRPLDLDKRGRPADPVEKEQVGGAVHHPGIVEGQLLADGADDSATKRANHLLHQIGTNG